MLGAILDVAIALVFVFVLFSLVVSALNEIWLSFMDKRADFLIEGLAELLQDPNRTPMNHWNCFQKKKPPHAVAQLCGHGLINALSRPPTGIPSYIAVESFVPAMLDIIRPANPAVDRTLADFRESIAKIENAKLKESLTAILDAAGDDLSKFKTGISAWYDRTMDRVSGWYKRYVQMWLLYLALFLAITANVDTIHIVHELSLDPQLRAALVKQATDYSQKQTQESTAPPAPSDATGLGQLLTKSQEKLTTLYQLRLPIGWDVQQRAYFYDQHVRLDHVLTALVGWFITALAASLGAPFWFDVLQRFVNIRVAGRAPDEKDLPGKKPASSGSVS
jgi:hypothetical protein